ncbi:MAG: heme-binding domain-containing protein [Ginsengibacter sp.]
MSSLKKIILALLIVFVASQFIQPARNKSKQLLATDFVSLYPVPDSVQTILQNACYDCHSNNTSYPWYVNIQPMGWIMKRHIDNGKAKLNFSEFGIYSNRRRVSKLKEISNQIKDDEMPITSYRTMHKNANLTTEEKVLVMNWINKITDSLSINN